MLPFEVVLTPGESPTRQIVYAATRAVVAGELQPGTPFPSVRELSQALKINPNTAHRVVQELVRDGLLDVHPGVGTVLSARSPGTAEARARLLSDQVERLVVEAGRLGVTRTKLLEAVEAQWDSLLGSEETEQATEPHEACTPARG
jgi:GntR family transcriptional regulator